MAALRLRIVARIGPRRASVLPRFVVASITAHAVAIAALVLVPALAGRTRMPEDAWVVDLVSAEAAAAPVSPGASAPPPPAAEPPEGVRATPTEPKPAPEKKPKEPEKKVEKKVEKKPEPKAPPPPAPAGTPGPPATVPAAGPSAPSADAASITAMEAGGVELAWYRDSVTSALYGSWVKPILEGVGQPAEVTVTFDILRDGGIADLRIESGSGIPTLDRSALRAVADAAPFPPLPAAWGRPRLSARFLFRLHPE